MLIVAEMIRCKWDQSTYEHFKEIRPDMDDAVEHYFLNDAAVPLFNNLLSYSPLNEPPRDFSTRDSEIHPFADGRRLDIGLSEMVNEFEDRVGGLKLYSGYQLMVYHPEDRALFYRLLPSQVAQLKSIIDPGEQHRTDHQVSGTAENQSAKVMNEKQASPEKEQEEKARQKALQDIRAHIGKLLVAPGFKDHFCRRYSELYKIKVDTQAAENFVDGQPVNNPTLLIKQLIECIPQAYGLGIAGECAASKFASVIPMSIYRDFRRMHQKRSPDISSAYYEYYWIMQDLEQYINKSGTQKGLFIAPLIESGQARGVIFLFEGDKQEKPDLHSSFIDSIAIARKTSQAVQDIRDQYYRICVTRDYIEQINRTENPTDNLTDLLTEYIHYVCNPQLALSLRDIDVNSADSVLRPQLIWFYMEHDTMGTAIWTSSTSPVVKGGFIERGQTDVARTISLDSQLLKQIKAEPRRPAVLPVNNPNEFVTLTGHKKSLQLDVNSVLIVPINEVNKRLDLLIMFFSEPASIIRANLISIWKKFSNLIVVHEYSMFRRKMDLRKIAAETIDLILKDEKSTFYALIAKLEKACFIASKRQSMLHDTCSFCGGSRGCPVILIETKAEKISDAHIARILADSMRPNLKDENATVAAAKSILCIHYYNMNRTEQKQFLESDLYVYLKPIREGIVAKERDGTVTKETLNEICSDYLTKLSKGLATVVKTGHNDETSDVTSPDGLPYHLTKALLVDEKKRRAMVKAGKVQEQTNVSSLRYLMTLFCILRHSAEHSAQW